MEWHPGTSTQGTDYEYEQSLAEEVNEWLAIEFKDQDKGHLDARYLKKDAADSLYDLMKRYGYTGVDILSGLFYDTVDFKDGGEGLSRFGKAPHNSRLLEKLGPVILRELRDPGNALEVMKRGRDQLAYTEAYNESRLAQARARSAA